jgi:D-alanyl-D-alanine-carboxypeptidase/D-alanyl-D-alanine-endopeptidase
MTSNVRRGICVSVALVSAWASAAAATMPDDAAIRDVIKPRVDSGRSVGIVAGVLDHGTRRVVAYGSSGSSRPLDGDTVFEIGSITKVFTAALLADMVARHEVSLDDPISKYLPPDVKAPTRNGRSITLVDLATQSSGLPRLPDNLAPKDPANPYADYTVEKLYDFLSRYELTRDVGERYEYSNLGVGLLGHLLARRAGTSYEGLLTKRILQPLGMRDTAITLSPSLKQRLAVGHDGAGRAAPNWDLPTLAGAGALRSTVNDLLKFVDANASANANANAGGSEADGLRAALRDAQRVRRPTGMPNMDIGLAWHVFHKFGVDLVWHNGGTGGYHSWLGFLPGMGVGAVVLSNSSTEIDDIGMHLVEPKFPLTSPPKIRKEISVAPAVLDAYVGEYQLTPTFAITVTRDGGSLFVQATGQGKLPIYAESETEFFMKVVDAQISFVKENGQVTSLVLHQNGQNVPGRKVK